MSHEQIESGGIILEKPAIYPQMTQISRIVRELR